MSPFSQLGSYLRRNGIVLAGRSTENGRKRRSFQTSTESPSRAIDEPSAVSDCAAAPARSRA